MNNSFNNSSFFTYSKIINNQKVANRLIFYYLVVFVLQFIFVGIDSNFPNAFAGIGLSFFTIGILLVIVSTRLSRFKLIKGRWFPLKLELPIYYKSVLSNSGKTISKHLAIRGESYNESYLNIFYKKEFYLCPLSKRNSSIKKPLLTYIEEKVFLADDETYYVAKVFLDDSKSRFDYYLLKPKLIGKQFTNKKSPLVALLRIQNPNDRFNTELKMFHFQFVEWAYPMKIQD